MSIPIDPSLEVLIDPPAVPLDEIEDQALLSEVHVPDVEPSVAFADERPTGLAGEDEYSHGE